MEEENKTEAAKPTKIEEAKAISEKIEKQLAEYKVLLEREEQLRADRLLSGEAEAGAIPAKPREETPAEYVARVSRGQI